MKINKIRTKNYYLSLSIFIVLIDQFTKYLMLNNQKLLINKDLILFKLDFVKIMVQRLIYLAEAGYFYQL